MPWTASEPRGGKYRSGFHIRVYVSLKAAQGPGLDEPLLSAKAA